MLDRTGMMSEVVQGSDRGAKLSRWQYLVLVVACAQGGVTERSNYIPTGVYKSLVIRGYLRPHRNGYGDGSKEYWVDCVDAFSLKWPTEQRARLAELRKLGATIAYWRSDSNGQPSNGGKRIDVAAPGVIHTAPGPLNLCAAGTLHATLIPPKWKGERWWIVALTGEVIGNEEKYGTLSREIIGECL